MTYFQALAQRMYPNGNVQIERHYARDSFVVTHEVALRDVLAAREDIRGAYERIRQRPQRPTFRRLHWGRRRRS